MSALGVSNDTARLYGDDSKHWQSFDEKIQDLTPAERDAVRNFWRSLVLRSQRAYREENGRLPLPQYAVAVDGNGNMRSCNCCPYGYHIDLDFVRYCEALANAKPSEDELRRRSRRRSRKSMEFMLGLDGIFDQWDAAERVQAVPELPHESESEHSAAAALTTVPCYTVQRARSSSVPRFATYSGGPSAGRPESPFGTASSTCSSMRGGTESDIPYSSYMKRQASVAVNSPPETRAFLHDALDEVCSDFERTLERASLRRKKPNGTITTTSASLMSFGSDRNNNSTVNGYGTKRNGYAFDTSFDIFDSCISGNKSPRASRSFSRSNTLPLQQKLSPAEVKYESYVKATVAANAKSPVEDLLPKHMTPPTPPPPPPPRRHAGQNKIFSPESNNSMDFAKSPSHSVGPLLSPLSTSTTEGTSVDAQTLFNIRQQMALSLKRMKDLEEQVRTIPEMQFELNQLREEKKRLQQSLQMKQEELQRQRPSPSPSPSPLASPKYASPVQFTPQRISPISLESLGARLRTSSVNSSSSERPKAVLKREVGTMCGQLHITRDIAVGSPVATLRTVGTSPAQRVRLSEMLYTEFQMNEQIEIAIKIYEEKRTLQNLKKLISVGTQMYVPQRADLRDSGMQTTIERAIQKYNVGVTAKPATRDNFVSCKPQLRDVGTSEHRITDILCERCATHKRTVACGTDEILDDKNRVAVSLKFLELSGRSNTFTLGDNEKLNVKRKTIGTQYTPMVVLHNTGCQTVIPLAHSIGIQISPETQSMSTQSQIDVKNIQTDTRDLIRLCATQTSTEEIAAPINPPSPIIEIRTIEVPMPVPVTAPAPKKPETRNTASNTEKPKTIESGVNTAPPVSIRHSSSNTDSVRKRDIGCGEIVKPHISISCADNYCDSCKDAIRVLAKEFTPHTPSKLVAPAGGPGPLLRANSDLSRIPRPKHITSPSPVRKPFQRQNTYTITPSPTPSPKADKKPIARALQEKPPSPSPAAVTVNVAQQEEFSKENYSFLNQQIRQSESRTALSEQSQSTASVETVIAQEPLKQQASPTPSQESSKTFDMPLIVKEEKRVSISWSRDASPAPSMTQSREGRKSLESSFNEKVKENLELAKKNLELSKKQIAEQQQQQQQQQEEEDTDVSKGARRKTSPSKSSQSGHVAREEDEALMQKLATIETEPRQKYTPSKELQRALKLINDSLLKKLGAKPISSVSLKASKATIQQEWFRISSTEKANPHEVEDHLDAFETLSVPLLEYCVNLSDGNGNTAMHYAVSHGNFDVVSILLDSKVCNVNQLNNAGYTSVMLVSLAKLKDPAHRTVVERLFQMADVNIRAKKHCQTALMLAVSHGNSDMVQMLLAAGADINIQDEDGSTALMCAAEHGRVDIVKQLLSKSECDSLLQDVDGSTAFKIAWQAGHKDIGLLLYVHEQMLRSKMPNRGINIDIRTSSISPKLFKNTK